LQIVRDLAGYSMGRSDLVRRAMSKKKHKVMEEERKNFIYGIEADDGEVVVEGCIRKGITPEAANKIYDSMMDFASYAFNKSHAAAYAVVAYYTAYCVCYFPHEFMAAMLNSVKGNGDKVPVYARAARDMNIEILPPDINESFAKFTVKEDKIRFGLTAIKNVGENIIDNICAIREEKGKFTSFEDFCSKIDTSCINKRVIESLIRAGAFDTMNVYRSKLLSVFELILDSMANQKKKNIKGQMTLFGIHNEEFEEIQIKYPDLQEFDRKNILSMEKEITGLYLSGHPLEEYEETLRKATSIKLCDLIDDASLEDDIIDESVIESKGVSDGDRVIIGGIISGVTNKITKNNNMMAFIKVEDLFGSVEVIIFPKIFERFKSLLEEDNIVLLKGRISIREEEQPKVICDTIESLEKVSKKSIYILIDKNKDVTKVKNEVSVILKQNKGNIPIFICTKEKGKFMLTKDLWVNENEKFLNFLFNRFGDNNVKII
jgi:DNA polymerase-3 subunit alpha